MDEARSTEVETGGHGVCDWKVSDPKFGVASSFGDLRGRLAVLCIVAALREQTVDFLWGNVLASPAYQMVVWACCVLPPSSLKEHGGAFLWRSPKPGSVLKEHISHSGSTFLCQCQGGASSL